MYRAPMDRHARARDDEVLDLPRAPGGEFVVPAITLTCRTADYVTIFATKTAAVGPKRGTIWGKPNEILQHHGPSTDFAAAHPSQVAGPLAFSPGEFIAGHSIRAAAAKLTCPIFATSAADPTEITAARTILAASPSIRKTQFLPRHGVHGTSTLRADSNPAGVSENWQAVKAFLESIG